MTLNYTQIFDETLKSKFKELVQSGHATGGAALAALKEQLDRGDESELDWVVSNLRRLSLPWGYCLHHAKAPKCPYGQNACFTKDNGPCHKLVTTPEHAPVIVATLEDPKKSRSIAREKGWEMYANDLGDQMAWRQFSVSSNRQQRSGRRTEAASDEVQGEHVSHSATGCGEKPASATPRRSRDYRDASRWRYDQLQCCLSYCSCFQDFPLRSKAFRSRHADSFAPPSHATIDCDSAGQIKEERLSQRCADRPLQGAG